MPVTAGVGEGVDEGEADGDGVVAVEESLEQDGRGAGVGELGLAEGELVADAVVGLEGKASSWLSPWSKGSSKLSWMGAVEVLRCQYWRCPELGPVAFIEL